MMKETLAIAWSQRPPNTGINVDNSKVHLLSEAAFTRHSALLRQQQNLSITFFTGLSFYDRCYFKKRWER